MGKYTVYIKLANRQTWWKINRQLANIFNSVFLFVGAIAEKPANHPMKSSAISWDCPVMLLIYRSKTASTDMKVKVKKVTSITTYGLNSQNSYFITFQCTVTNWRGGEGRRGHWPLKMWSPHWGSFYFLFMYRTQANSGHYTVTRTVVLFLRTVYSTLLYGVNYLYPV